MSAPAGEQHGADAADSPTDKLSDPAPDKAVDTADGNLAGKSAGKSASAVPIATQSRTTAATTRGRRRARPAALNQWHDAVGSRRSQIVVVVAIVVLALVVLGFWQGFQRPGHDSGDDFALYINQTRSLLDGDVGGTIANNKFTVDNSQWHTFSPYVYPWGQPLLLVPAAMLAGVVDPTTGIDYAPYKLVISLTLLVALGVYFLVARRRVGGVVAGAMVAYFVTDRHYAGATDAVLSEFPFFMWTMLFVWWLDRLLANRQVLTASRRSMIVLAAFAWMAFETRREGLGLVLGVVVAQLIAVYGALGPGSVWTRVSRLDPRAGRLGPAIRRSLALPWIAFVGLVVALQLVLPTDFLPRYSERDPAATVGLSQIPRNLVRYRPVFGELLGFEVDSNVVTILNSATFASAVMASILLLAIVGIVTSLVRSPQRDAAMIAAFVGLTLAVLMTPFQSMRYLMCLLPFIVLFAVMGVNFVLDTVRLRQRDLVSAVGTVLVCLLLSIGLGDSLRARDYLSHWTGPTNGPQRPETLAMFAQIRQHTRGDDIIVYGRARTMTLYTGRPSVQGGGIEFTRRAGDYYVMYLNADGTPGDYSQYPLTVDEANEFGFVELWRNSLWVIFKIPEPDLSW